VKIAEYAAKIKDRNRYFQKLPRAKQRIAVARDVLRALKDGVIEAKSGDYMSFGGEDRRSALLNSAAANPEGAFVTSLAELPSCRVCAKAALFVCAATRDADITNNKAYNMYFYDSRLLSKTLKGVFSAKQLRLIETEFEGLDFECRADYFSPVMKLTDLPDRDRMVAIMKNIVANHGTFKPKAPK